MNVINCMYFLLYMLVRIMCIKYIPLEFQNVPGPCILRTFPAYINLTTGPDQPKSVKDRASNYNHNSSVCIKLLLAIILGLEGWALGRSETAEVALT